MNPIHAKQVQALSRKADALLARFGKRERVVKTLAEPTRKVRNGARRAAKKSEWGEIKMHVRVRADHCCEVFGCELPIFSVDHWLGGSGRRLAEQSVESCWALCAIHDDNRTNNWPSAAKWNREREKHCKRWGYEFVPHKELR